MTEVVVKVAHLFAGHFDLQEEFVSFLPVDAQMQVIYLLLMYENKNSWASEDLFARFPQLIPSKMSINFSLKARQTFKKGVGSVEHTQAAANSTSNSQAATTPTSSAGKSRTLKRKAAPLGDSSPGGKKG